MQKPDGYDEARVQGEFTPVELGGHVMVILEVKETKNKNGGDMIVVSFDFDKSDAQAGYFAKLYKSDTRGEKKWPNQATQYINVYTSENKCTSGFKTFCTCVERSNAGFQAFDAKGAFYAAGFKGKKVGGVFGEQLDFYNGKENKKRVLRWFRSIDKVKDAEIPDVSETSAWKEWQNNGGKTAPQAGTAEFEQWMNIPENIDEDLPFN